MDNIWDRALIGRLFVFSLMGVSLAPHHTVVWKALAMVIRHLSLYSRVMESGLCYIISLWSTGDSNSQNLVKLDSSRPEPSLHSTNDNSPIATGHSLH